MSEGMCVITVSLYTCPHEKISLSGKMQI